MALDSTGARKSDRGVGRRTFLAFTGATTLTFFPAGRAGAVGPAAGTLSMTTPTLPPRQIPQFVTPVLIPPAMPLTRRIRAANGKWVDFYDITLRQFEQRILPPGLPLTTVWGYGPRGRPGLHHAPSYTIEARRGRPVRVRWTNRLVDGDGRFLPHLFPVDPTLHWANPGRVPGHHGLVSTDIRPDYMGRTYVRPEDYTDPATQYTWYDGPVPAVTHLHGAMGVGDESDGYTEAWVLPDAVDIPRGYARHGRWFEYFATKARERLGVTWGRGYQVSQYPNVNRACQQWFHDHVLGMTRLNVYAGGAGFYVVRGGKGGEDDIVDRRTGARAVLPGPWPRRGDRPGIRYREISLAVQDRAFNRDGSLFYPDTRAFFDDVTGPFIPETDIAPMWNPEFFGNTLIVNGNTWPYLEVERRRYRLRYLNGTQSRALILDFRGIPGISVWQIGTESGLLEEAFNVMRRSAGQVLLGPAERADLIVDFGQVPVGRWVLGNVGPDEPYGGGEFEPADPRTTGRVMQFRVVPATGPDRTTPGEHLVLPRIGKLPPPDRVRRLALIEEMSHHVHDAPAEAAIGVVKGDPAKVEATAVKLEWSDPVTENPGVGDTEIWEIYNLTADAHPVHVHEVAFQVLSRQGIIVEEMERTVRLDPHAPLRGPRAGENGRKDTVIAYPGEVTRIKAQFNTPGQFVWHCHILEHEDNEMMRPFRVGPRDPDMPPDLPGHGG